MQAREGDAVAMHIVRRARTERARARRWGQRLAERATACEDRPAAAEAVRRALEQTERAAQEIEARLDALQRESA